MQAQVTIECGVQAVLTSQPVLLINGQAHSPGDLPVDLGTINCDVPADWDIAEQTREAWNRAAKPIREGLTSNGTGALFAKLIQMERLQS